MQIIGAGLKVTAKGLRFSSDFPPFTRVNLRHLRASSFPN
jgi:hypothetical protein